MHTCALAHVLTPSTSDPLLLLLAAVCSSLCTHVLSSLCPAPPAIAAATAFPARDPDPRAAMRWDEQGLFRNEARTQQVLPVQNRTQAPMGLTGQAQHRRAAQKTMLCSSKHPYMHLHVATSALSQPGQGLAAFALMSPARNSTAATSSFPSPAPRDPSLAEHPQHLLPRAMQPACEQPMSHPGCRLSSVPLRPGHSCKAVVTLC